MELFFQCYGHENLLGTHAKTLEITKDKHLTLKGDCIVGVNADFSSFLLKPLLEWKKAEIIFECEGVSDSVIFEINPLFLSESELVIRKSKFISERTFGICADKGASDLSRDLIEKLKNSKAVLFIKLKNIDNSY